MSKQTMNTAMIATNRASRDTRVDYPFLTALKWQGDRARHLTEEEEIHLYEREWRLVDVLATPDTKELHHIKAIAMKHHSWLAGECDKRIALNTDIATV